MENSENLMSLIETIGVSVFVAGGTAFAALKFLGQRFLDHKLGKDFERYKTELGEKTEALKTQLSIYSHEQAIEFSRVDAQSAKATSEVYARMREIINPLTRLNAGTPIVNGTDRHSLEYYFTAAEAAHAGSKQLANTLADHAIYFDNSTYIRIADFVNATSSPIAEYLRPLRLGIAEGKSDSALLILAEESRALLRKACDGAIFPQHQELVSIFRKNLGIER